MRPPKANGVSDLYCAVGDVGVGFDSGCRVSVFDGSGAGGGCTGPWLGDRFVWCGGAQSSRLMVIQTVKGTVS